MPVSRTVVVNDPRLLGFLKEKEATLLKGKAIHKKVEALQQEQRKIGLELNRLKERVIPLVQRAAKSEVGEYEFVASVNVVKGKVEITLMDALEEFKQAYAAKKLGKNNPPTNDGKGAEEKKGKKA